MSWFDRRRSGAILLIALGLVSVYFGWLIQPTGVQPSPPKPGGGGGGNGGGAADLRPPSTAITIVGNGYAFTRANVQYYSSVTVTLNATDNQGVDKIYLSDNQSSVPLPELYWSAARDCAWTTITIAGQGVHMLQYYSVDKAGNKESPHTANAAVGNPKLSDLTTLIASSGIDNTGLQNALLAKVRSAEHEQLTGHGMNSLHALSNQLSALEGKHGLDKPTIDNIQKMIQLILAS